MGLTRRNFLKGLIALVATQGLSSCANINICAPLITSKIERLACVINFQTQNSKYHLINIGQMHDRDIETMLEGEREIQEAYQGIINTQKEIYQIILELKKSTGVSEIYTEGISEKIKEKVDEIGYKNFYNLWMKEILKRNYFKRKEIPDMEYITGATTLLAMEGEIEILAGETHSNLITARNHEHNPNQYERRKRMLEDRETNLLKIISEKTEPQLAISTFGALHNFKDNIEKWNKENPSNKFSYTFIIPRSMIDYFNKHPF